MRCNHIITSLCKCLHISLRISNYVKFTMNSARWEFAVTLQNKLFTQ